MRNSFKILIAMVCLVALGTGAVRAQEIARTPDGKPDLSGIWQAITAAHFDVEPHAASEGPHPGLMGAISAVPASLGIVEGGKIPYT